MQLIFEGKSIFLSSALKSAFLLPEKFKKIPFEKIKNDILGNKYELSIVFIGLTRSKFLNNKYRAKNKPTDVLSFEIDKNHGEIFITPRVAQKKFSKFEMNYENYLLFLVIHAMLHLKGMEHGSKMDKYEFTYHNRYRRRYL